MSVTVIVRGLYMHNINLTVYYVASRSGKSTILQHIRLANSSYDLTQTKKIEKIREIRTNLHSSISAVLTGSQSKSWPL